MGAKNLGAELAVRFADHLHGVLVIDDVARRRIDVAARAVARPILDLVDELVAVELAVELLDGVKDGVDRVLGIGRFKSG